MNTQNKQSELSSDSASFLLIGNPASQNGRAEQEIERTAALIESKYGSGSLDIMYTKSSEHAIELAENSGLYEILFVLGGDGIIHHVVNGLMKIEKNKRPALGVIPMVSGNDFARSTGISFSLEKAIDQLFHANPQWIDIGKCNGEYFAETLSFGLDAAIALGTIELRKKTGKSGTALYVQSGIDQLLHHRDSNRFKVGLYGSKKKPVQIVKYPSSGQISISPVDSPQKDDSCQIQYQIAGESIIFAIQLGSYYGGGFCICPHATHKDGYFHICIANPPFSFAKALVYFLRAKSGKHLGYKQMSFYKASALHLAFEDNLPIQYDGEPCLEKEFNIEIHPSALRVLIP